MTTIEIKPGTGAASPQGAIAMKKLLAFYTLWTPVEIDYLGQTDSDGSYNSISFKVDDDGALAREFGVHRLVFLDGKLRYTVFLRVIVNGKESDEHIRNYVYDPYTLFKNLNTDHSTKELTQETITMLIDANREKS